MNITETEIRKLIRSSIRNHIIAEREDFDPEAVELAAKREEKRQADAAAKKAQQAEFQKGNVPPGTKLATEEEGEPKVVRIGTVTLNGQAYPVGKIYSQAKRFDPVREGYGSYLTRDMILKGKFDYPAEFGYVTGVLKSIGNVITSDISAEDPDDLGGMYESFDPSRRLIESPKLYSGPQDDPYKYQRREDGWYTTTLKTGRLINLSKNPKFSSSIAWLDKTYPNAIPDSDDIDQEPRKSPVEPNLKVARSRLDKGNLDSFYRITGLFVMKISPGLWKKPVFRSTRAGVESSQRFGCVLSKTEIFTTILKIGDGGMSDQDIERVIPCFAAVSDSIVYDLAATVISVAVGIIGTPAAGIGTYATAQIVPALPVLIYHMSKKNWKSAAFYLTKIALSIFGSAASKVGKVIILGVLEAVMSILHTFSVSITEAEKTAIMSYIKGETLNEISANLSTPTNDPQGFVKIYTSL